MRNQHGNFTEYCTIIKKCYNYLKVTKLCFEVIKLCSKMAEKFTTIEDFRCQCDVKHKLCDVLILVMCEVFSGLVGLVSTTV
jgi:hypothetical protein